MAAFFEVNLNLQHWDVSPNSKSYSALGYDRQLTMDSKHMVSGSLNLDSIKALLAATSGSAPICTIVADPQFRVLFANEAAEAIFGTGESGIVGENILGVLGNLNDSLDLNEFREDISRSGVFEGQMFLDKHGGSQRLINFSCRKICDRPDRQAAAYVFTAEEPSGPPPRTDLEAVALDRMLTRGEMAAEIVHEINNDLTILLGNIELFPLLLASGDTSRIATKLPLMKETLEKIAGLAESLVSYGKPQECLEPVGLKRIISDVIAFLKPQNRFDSIRIAAELSSDISPVMGDSGQLQQVMVNLLNNAADELRECGEAEPVIQVRTGRSDDGTSTVISVSDNGRGIPNEIRPRLFNERFTTKETGEGYGLIACYQIAKRHGGDILFNTRPGEGTRFELRLPTAERLREKTVADEDIHTSAMDQYEHGAGPPVKM